VVACDVFAACFVGPFDELAVLERGAGAHEGDRHRRITRETIQPRTVSTAPPYTLRPRLRPISICWTSDAPSPMVITRASA
jgi:hypothetical protein